MTTTTLQSKLKTPANKRHESKTTLNVQSCVRFCWMSACKVICSPFLKPKFQKMLKGCLGRHAFKFPRCRVYIVVSIKALKVFELWVVSHLFVRVGLPVICSDVFHACGLILKLPLSVFDSLMGCRPCQHCGPMLHLHKHHLQPTHLWLRHKAYSSSNLLCA